MKRAWRWLQDAWWNVCDAVFFWPWNTILAVSAGLLAVVSVAALFMYREEERAELWAEFARQEYLAGQETEEYYWEDYTALVVYETTLVPYVPTNLDWPNWDQRPWWFDQVNPEMVPGETLLLMCQVGNWYGQKGVVNPENTNWFFVLGVHVDVPVYVSLPPCEGFPSHAVPVELPEGLEDYLDRPGTDWDPGVG